MSRLLFVFAYNPAMAKTLAELTADMHAFVAAKGWYAPESPRPQTPRNIATSLAIEAAEVLELYQWGEPERAEALAGEQHRAVLVWRANGLILDRHTTLGAIDHATVAQILGRPVVVAVHVEDRFGQGRHYELQIVKGHIAAPNDEVDVRKALFDARAVDQVDDFVAQGQDLHGSVGG